MSPSWRWALLIVTALLCFGVGVWFATAPKLGGGSGLGEGRKSNTTIARDFKPGSRTVVAGPSTPAQRPAVARSVEPVEGKPAASSGPVDKREGTHADSAAIMAALQEKIAKLRPDISECIGGWMELDPGLAGEVEIGFQLEHDGLTEAWVVDHSDVPFGPRSCFGAAIAAADWSGVGDEPLEVTLRFGFSPEDPTGLGAADGEPGP